MTVGERIKKLRNEKGMTQQQLANAIGVQHSAISKYEKNIVNISAEQLNRIANALNVESWELMCDGSINFDNTVDPNSPAPTKEQIFQSFETIKNSFKNLNETMLETYADNDEYIRAYYNMLNHTGKKEALKRTEELTHIEKYTASDNSTEKKK